MPKHDPTPNPNAIHGPHPERRQYGVVKPEQISQADPASDTTDQQGIEIDHAAERPHDELPA